MDKPVLKYTHEDFEIVVRTDNVDNAWERFQGRINYRNDWTEETSHVKSYCSYSASEGCTIELYDYCSKNLVPIEKDVLYWPVVYETNKYHISILFKDIDEGTTPKARHIKKEVEDFFFYDFGRLSGEVNFLNEPGLFKMGIEYVKGGRKKESWFTFDVVSPKLDVKEDYKSILRSVNAEFEGLIFRYFSLTMQQLAEGRRQPIEVWMQVFEDVVANYLKSVDRIIKNPHSKVRTLEVFDHADRIKRWTPAMEEVYKEKEAENRLEEYYFRYEIYDNTVNSLENRFVKHTLKQISKKLDGVFSMVLDRNITEISKSHREHWLEYQRKIKKYLKHPFFQSVGKFEGLRQESLVLQSRMGYQQVYKDWLKLRKGIDFYKGLTNVGTLQIWEIYELWCFIKVKQMVLRALRLKQDSPLITEPNGSLISYQKSASTDKFVDYRACIKYPTIEETDNPEMNSNDMAFAVMLNQHAGESISIHYQHTFSRIKEDDLNIRSLTTEQRPDIILNIKKPDGEILTYLYDAKYRVWGDRKLDRTKDWYEQDQDMIQDLKGADYPPADAINQMHRYRDAIYYGMTNSEKPKSKEVIGGYILFPGRGDETSIANRFYTKSIEQVNIGAFTLLPSGKEATTDTDPDGPQLYSHLVDILLKRTSYVEHVDTAIPQRGLYYLPDDDGVSIIVGCYKNENHHEWIKNNLKYNMRLDKGREGSVKLNGGFTHATYLVLYSFTDQKQIEVYHLTGEYNVLIKSEMIELGYPDPAGEKYLVVDLDTNVDKRLESFNWDISSPLFKTAVGTPVLMKYINLFPPEESFL